MAETPGTAAQDRLSQLFAFLSKPAPPVPGQRHFSEVELEKKEAEDQRSWSIPSTAQYPRQVKSPQNPARNVDCLTSSDEEDDYVSAFKPKVSMKNPERPHPRKMPEHKTCGEVKKSLVEGEGPIQYIAKGKVSSKFKATDGESKDGASDECEDSLPVSDTRGHPATDHFCQFSLAAKFPYKYMNDSNDRVSRRFFAANKFYERTWDLYYLDPPYSLSSKPILLVPHAQFKQLVDEISETFKVPVSVPGYPFTLTFYDDGTPQPKLLGTSKSRAKAGELQDFIPPASADHGECSDSAAPDVKKNFDAFRERCRDALAANKKKNHIVKKKKEEDRLLTIRDWYSQLRRCQRYLGLRPKAGVVEHPDPNMPWSEQEQFRRQQLKKARIVLDPLDVHLPAPYPIEKEPVIISIDIESYERDHKIITEIGVSTLDTLDLVKLPPGQGGKIWTSQIRSRHFRIQGREHFVNRDFCIGNPDAFQFGRSEFVALGEAAAKVDSCFEWPFSVQFKHPGSSDTWTSAPTSPTGEQLDSKERSSGSDGVSIGPSNSEQAEANRAAMASVLEGISDPDAIKLALDLAEKNRPDPNILQQGPKERNIILLGHDIRSDLEYLRTLGSKIFGPSRGTYPVAAMEVLGSDEAPLKILASILEALDTAPLYRVLKQETQPRSLSSILDDLGIPCYFPHNGGNDARYTMEALIAMVVKARLEEDTLQKEDEDVAMGSMGLPLDDPAQDGANDPVDVPTESAGRGPSATTSRSGNARAVFATSLPTKHELDDFEAAILADSGSEATPPRQVDLEIAALTERLKLDPSLDEEEPKRRFRGGRDGGE
ncbi:hypothetical protein A1O3_00967 [Capronia epimyces CBS 606.96]|uniref:Gfd2/YDR514C-like C-terminal domain-containing protein n=1 Tax=Capronia epimyces CBS 606.96 TaxID=1182542 RepID=W9YT45_9EURO|nr:uncharacterized protein A1O3_00967 [Capronia epimyces CBS 606.96]EXJ92416.1 hypothetical protein A1O3_00967 [Capronia epimyces CBS 606.96]